MREELIKSLAQDIGLTINAHIKTHRTVTTEVTAALCRIAASASAHCSTEAPADGVEFGVNEFLTQIALQCKTYKIKSPVVELATGGVPQ